MTLQSTAQTLYVIDPTSPASQLPVEDTHSSFDLSPASDLVHHHEPEQMSQLEGMPSIEVGEPVDIEIVVEELPGAPAGTKDPEPMIEVAEEPLKADEGQADSDKKGKGKNEKWNWEAHGPHGFVAWVKSRLSEVPKHSGFDSAGLERATAYMERLDSEISKAMRLDLDEELDANKIEKIRSELDEGLSRLQSRLDKVKKNKKSNRKKKAEYEVDEEGFIKEAQKIIGVSGVYITVPLLISGLARVCVNGTVSAGHDIEDLYTRQVNKWKLTDREQFELRQMLFDMGYPMRVDRGFMPDDNLEVSDSSNMDWAANYRG